MDRYTATRLVLRICVLAFSIGPAAGQVQVGELMVTPEADGVTVTLARDQPEPALAMLESPAPQPYRPAITRIRLNDGELPGAAMMQPSTRPLPPMPAPRTHEMERDVLTLKAAHAAMLLDDQQHMRSKLASLR
ncbi:hypothetical protein GCM10027277_02870 [Pseudoduganella ginsengisoli]|uniref:Uncharacterized protein n=1 Tax=Pseudoduganella ginsengisoli TaxID=1462440 RepID=A0A6L6Q6I9_9BURK|nr:hypothetical protein [Pseudoduganella ginsengisoli]MTW04722.1 hypothetical protein [Pseudoduganella ginsengisoli]